MLDRRAATTTGLLTKATRRYSLFYLAAGVTYFVLAFGLNGPLFAAYARLPFGRLFRDPHRFMWMPGF